jgi:prevent-host-death family protein
VPAILPADFVADTVAPATDESVLPEIRPCNSPPNPPFSDLTGHHLVYSKLMDTVGTFEAKTHLTRLLDRVAAGEQITITRHGTPIARLVPVRPSNRRQIRETIARLKEFSKGQTLAGLKVKDLINEGRR